jgi:hypothetical protein
MAYVIAIINALAGYLLADEAVGVIEALWPLVAGAWLAACGYLLSAHKSRFAGAGLLLGTVVIVAIRWMTMGRPGPLIPSVIAVYIFWEGFEAAGEWARLRGHTIPTEDGPRRAI